MEPAPNAASKSFFGPNLVLAPGPVPDVPEIDPGSAAGALALLVMGATMLNGRCRTRAA